MYMSKTKRFVFDIYKKWRIIEIKTDVLSKMQQFVILYYTNLKHVNFDITATQPINVNF